MLRPILASVAALLLAGACAADQSPQPESALELTGRVVDAAEILEPDFEAELTQTLAQLEEDTLVQLVIATTPDLEGQSIEEYSLDLARGWAIGSAQRDDGLLVLIAPNERKVRIEVGYGLEASVKDEEAAQIIQDDMLPSFRNEDFQSGVAAGVERLIQEVTPIQLEEAA